MAAAVSAETAPCSRSISAGTPSSAAFTSFAYETIAAEKTSLEPGTEVSRAATSPPVHDSAVASVSPRSRHSFEHELLDRRLVRVKRYWSSDSTNRRSSSSARASAPGSTKRSTWISKSRAQIVTSTPSPSPPAAASAWATADSPDAVEPQHAARRRLRAREQPPQRLRLECARPELLQLARRPGQRRPRRVSAELEHERRRGAREPDDDAPSGIVACLRTPGSKSAYGRRSRSATASRASPICASSSSSSRAAGRRPREQLDRPVVVRRPEPARDDEQVVPEPFPDAASSSAGASPTMRTSAGSIPSESSDRRGTARSGRCGRRGRARARDDDRSARPGQSRAARRPA